YGYKMLEECWTVSIRQNGSTTDWIKLITWDLGATRAFLTNPDEPIDLIVPRGGEQLIAFVKEHARCAVLVSGRGNNFAYIASDADWERLLDVVVNAKMDKISACNALDKILIDSKTSDLERKLAELKKRLAPYSVQTLADEHILPLLEGAEPIA